MAAHTWVVSSKRYRKASLRLKRSSGANYTLSIAYPDPTVPWRS